MKKKNNSLLLFRHCYLSNYILRNVPLHFPINPTSRANFKLHYETRTYRLANYGINLTINSPYSQTQGTFPFVCILCTVSEYAARCFGEFTSQIRLSVYAWRTAEDIATTTTITANNVNIPVKTQLQNFPLTISHWS